MRPSQRLRLWAKRGPTSERAAAVVVALLVVALLAWIVVPGSDGGSVLDVTAGTGLGTRDVEVTDGVAGPVAPGGGSPTANTAGPAGGGGTGPTPALGDGGGATETTEPGETTPEGAAGGEVSACLSPSGSLRGVTDEEVHVAVALTEIVGPAANDVFDLPPPPSSRPTSRPSSPASTEMVASPAARSSPATSSPIPPTRAR